MESSKAKLPKRVFDFIESERFYDEREQNHWKQRVLSQVLKFEFSLEGFSFETLMEALVNGYEVESSPEDKVRESIEFWRHGDEKGNVYDGPTIAAEICRVLGLLNIKIEGVNGHEK